MRRSLVVLALLAACRATSADTPPAVAWGEVGCSYCHMTVMSESHPAQLVPAQGATRGFDEPGCLFHYLAGQAPAPTTRAWVRTEDTGQWLDARAATYLVPARMPPGMMYGVLAFADSSGARAWGTGRLAGFDALRVELLQ